MKAMMKNNKVHHIKCKVLNVHVLLFHDIIIYLSTVLNFEQSDLCIDFTTKRVYFFLL